jgi:hypothetical protein
MRRLGLPYSILIHVGSPITVCQHSTGGVQVTKHTNYVSCPSSGSDAEIQRWAFILGRAAETRNVALQHATAANISKRNVQDVQIPVPWGHVAGRNHHHPIVCVLSCP